MKSTSQLVDQREDSGTWMKDSPNVVKDKAKIASSTITDCDASIEREAQAESKEGDTSSRRRGNTHNKQFLTSNQ